MAIEKIELGQAHRLRDFYYEDTDYFKVGSLNHIECYASYEDTDITVCFTTIKNHRCGHTVAEFQLNKPNEIWRGKETHRNNDVYEVGMSIVNSKFQGMNLAPKFYRYFIKKLDIVLKAGTCQSPGGRYIWNELNKFDDIAVYAKSLYGQPHPVECDDDNRELFCEGHKLYDGSNCLNVYACAA